jgi:hypothetical protein
MAFEKPEIVGIAVSWKNLPACSAAGDRPWVIADY